jgi:Ca2+-binding EF-hand superfamily protein
MFRRLDKDGNGYLDANEQQQALKEMHEGFRQSVFSRRSS